MSYPEQYDIRIGTLASCNQPDPAGMIRQIIPRGGDFVPNPT